jgi:hypothetical protein
MGRLVIQQAQMDEIKAVLAEIHATPEWQAKAAAEAKAAEESARYEAGREQMRRVMGY